MKHLLKIGILVVLVVILVSGSFAEACKLLVSPPIQATNPGASLTCNIVNLDRRPMDVTIEVCSSDGTCNPATFPSVAPGHTVSGSIVGVPGIWYCKFSVSRKKVQASICSNLGCVAVKK